MNELSHLPSHSFPKALDQIFTAQKIFKFALIYLAISQMICLCALVWMGIKDPVVYTFDVTGKEMVPTKDLKLENQITMALKIYVDSRYSWDEKTIEVKLKDAKNFVEKKNEKLFDSSMNDLLKFAKEKSVSQKIYIEVVHLDWSSRVALITGDRVTSIQGLKAASNLRLTLEFTEGPRTRLNPWGIYITKEREQ
jgi:hypothetical protein